MNLNTVAIGSKSRLCRYNNFESYRASFSSLVMDAAAVKRHWTETISSMQEAVTKVSATWLDYSKGYRTKRSKQLEDLNLRLKIAATFVNNINGTEVSMNQAASAIVKLNETAAIAAAFCWKRRIGGMHTQDELNAEHDKFEEHRTRLTKVYSN